MLRRELFKYALGLLAFPQVLLYASKGVLSQNQNRSYPKIALPKVTLKGSSSFEYLLYNRRSVRNYTNEPISLEELSQVLWAADGQTPRDTWMGRTAPSSRSIISNRAICSYCKGKLIG